MVKIMENPIKMDDLGGKPTIFWKHPFGGLRPKEENFCRRPFVFCRGSTSAGFCNVGAGGGTTRLPGMERASPVDSDDFWLTSKLYSKMDKDQ